MPLLEVTHISKSFAHTQALRRVSFSLDQGEILGILGPSGCGKTTLLRILAGIETPDSGRISFDGKDMADVPPHRRHFGMMFQDFALFPHKTVFDNVGFGLLQKKLPSQEITRRVHELLALVGLVGFSNRGISYLSGGERQRIALARSLAPNPRLLLLDEPMGSLDRELRERLVPEIKAILQHIGLTAVFVTHDHAEAYAMADEVAVMNQGQIEQQDSPENLYRLPRNRRVATFLGFENFVDGTVIQDGRVQTRIGVFYPANLEKNTPGKTVTLLIRPEAAELVSDEGKSLHQTIERDSQPVTMISGIVTQRLFQGRFYRLKMETPEALSLTFDLSNAFPPPQIGFIVNLAIFSPGVVCIG
jgi:ABC-type Fe3+/spermidine/putrescine transport system ATPase subunit